MDHWIRNQYYSPNHFKTLAMTGPVTVLFCTLLLAVSYGEAIKCYHCYDSFNKETNNTFGALNGTELGEKFVRCEKNKNNWNTWDCPAAWPVCLIMSGRVRGHYEVVRSCAEENFCSKYVPPMGVKVDNCRECNTTLCNDYPQLPDPPVGPDPLFTFNVNINLNVYKTRSDKYSN